jgi:hypothetical protein
MFKVKGALLSSAEPVGDDGSWLTSNDRTASSKSCSPCTCRERDLFSVSSSLEFCVESGGDMMAPAGIPFEPVIGGGDCRRLDVVVPAAV